jgi:hypothetical protein
LCDELKINSHSCECKAGTEKCSHLVALLYNVAHFKKLGLHAVPPILSKTSEPQTWNVPSRALGLHTKPISELTVQKLKRGAVYEGVQSSLYCPIQLPIPWADTTEKLIKSLEEHEPGSQMLGILKENFETTLTSSKFGMVPKGCPLSYQCKNTEPTPRDYPIHNMFDAEQVSSYSYVLSKVEQNLYISCEFDKETCIEIEKKTMAQSKSALWRSVRIRRLTASNFHRVFV